MKFPLHFFCNFSSDTATNQTMKSLKINLEENLDFGKLSELLIQIKGIRSVEIIDESKAESDLKKAVDKGKQQLKSGDYDSLVNDLFETFLNKKP